jgi:GNAT superfamily N-acetyltransferase
MVRACRQAARESLLRNVDACPAREQPPEVADFGLLLGGGPLTPPNGQNPRMDVAISRISPDQLDDVREAFLALHQHHQEVSAVPVHADAGRAWELRRAVYEEVISGDDGFALAARDGRGRVVAYAVVKVHRGPDDTFPYRGDHGEVYSLSVLPDLRGAGVGSQLLDAVDRELDAVGITDLAIAALAGNDGAIRLYQRRGLVPGEVVLYRITGARSDERG